MSERISRRLPPACCTNDMIFRPITGSTQGITLRIRPGEKRQRQHRCQGLVTPRAAGRRPRCSDWTSRRCGLRGGRLRHLVVADRRERQRDRAPHRLLGHRHFDLELGTGRQITCGGRTRLETDRAGEVVFAGLRILGHLQGYRPRHRALVVVNDRFLLQSGILGLGFGRGLRFADSPAGGLAQHNQRGLGDLLGIGLGLAVHVPVRSQLGRDHQVNVPPGAATFGSTCPTSVMCPSSPRNSLLVRGGS